MHLSKSDFKVARTCGTKLYYRKLGYPSSKEGNPYLEFLADGGYMVEAIAKLMFPDGREIGFERGDDAVALTRVALDQENAVLFEATVRYGLLLARVDILVKRGNEFRLIEVKAKSFNSKTDGDHPFRGKKGGIDAGWRPYLEDVAFQTHILRSMLPDAKVTPCLCLVDKAKTSCKRRLKSAAGGTEWCGGRKVRHLQINHGGCSLICSNGPRYAAEF
jgi:hypothetical protein